MAGNKVVNGYEFVTYSLNRHFQLFYSAKNSRTYPMHYHNAMEITMPMTKPYGCTGEQGFQSADAQEILFVGSGILHCVGPLKGQEGGSHYTLLADTDWLNQFQAFPLLREKTSSIFIVRTHMEHYAAIKEAMLSICQLYNSQDPYKDMVIAADFLQLITLIAREMEKAAAAESVPAAAAKSHFRQEILFSSHYIRENCAQDLTLESMGQMLSISKYYYHRKFKEICHLSFHEHLTRCRMDLACQYLKTESHSVEEIAHLCGYKSVSSFIHMFRQCFQVTPSQYRKASGCFPEPAGSEMDPADSPG